MNKFILTVGLAILVSGCASTQPETVSHLQTRVGELERQLELRDEQIKDLKYEVKDMSYEIERFRPPGGTTKTSSRRSGKRSGSVAAKEELSCIRVSASVSEVQGALQTAGYYDGAVDNKIGRKTKKAIMDFQRDNGLKADGIVGARTWTELKAKISRPQAPAVSDSIGTVEQSQDSQSDVVQE